MKTKITFRMMFSVFIIYALLCLTNCSNDEPSIPVFTSEALEQTTWQAQRTVYNTKDEIEYTEKSVLQFITDSEGIETVFSEEDEQAWSMDFTYQVDGKIITFDKIGGTWTVLEYIGTYIPRNGSL